MNPRRFIAMARKEMIQILRDSRSLAIILVMPLLLMLMFGYGTSLDLKHSPLVICDLAKTPRSRDLTARFGASEYFRVIGHVDSAREAGRALDTGRAQAALVIPHDFDKQLAIGGAARVQLLVDATDDNSANILIGYSRAVVQGFSSEITFEFLARNGRSDQPSVMRVESRTWYNETLESKVFIVPGTVAMVMAVIGAFLTSLTIAREWERGTMEQLVSTPVRPLEVMLGKLVPYFVIGMLDAALCAAMAVYVFGVPFRGTLLTLTACTAMFLVTVLSQGYLLSVVMKNQLAASQAALVSTFLPAFLLSGFIFSIEQMPLALQILTRVLPARYYVSLLKNVFLKGTPLELLRGDLIPLAIFALILGMMATRAFKKRLA